jgi:outer membrane protein assembly factor BamE (lipoprotein component of BamABCDE complex)
VTGYGRYRAYVEIEGRRQAIGNDYSRDLDLGAFAQHYVVTQDPAQKLASYPAKVREAIKGARLMPGMTREQVLMSVGYPVSSENPKLDAKLWRYWLSSFAEFQVGFDNDRVKEIVTDAATRNLVVAD